MSVRKSTKKEADPATTGSGYLQDIIDSSLDVIQVFRANRNEAGNIINFTWLTQNKKGIEQNGDVTGKRVLQQNPGMVVSGIFDRMCNVVETGNTYEDEQYYTFEQFQGNWYYLTLVKFEDGVIMTTKDITRYKKVEQELLLLKEKLALQATGKYETLFNSMDEGFCIIEVMFDHEEKAYDYRFLETNPAFEKQTGLRSAVGKTMRMLAPGHEQYWFDIYGRIAKTGRSERFENKAAAIGHYYEVFAFCIDEPALHHVAVLFKDISERKKTEAALHRSEERYRAIFNSMNEGFSLLDIQFDEKGNANDVIIRDANAAQNRIDGIAALIGKRVREILPDIEMKWVERYANVARSGESISFEDWSEANQKWYKVQANRVGGSGSSLVAIIYDDITEQKNFKERQACLMNFSDVLRSISDPLEIQTFAANLLGKYLKVNQAHYGETVGNYIYIDYSYANAVPPMTGKIHYEDFGKKLGACFQAGKTQVCYNTATDTDVSPEEKKVFASAGIGAYIAMPLIKNNEWVAIMAVHNIEPRQWKQTEIDLMHEIVERTWIAVEKAKVEKALRLSEEQLANELADTRQLQMISAQIIEEDTMEKLYQQILDAAMAMMHANAASLQQYVPEKEALYLLASKHFAEGSARFWEWVRLDSNSSCALALNNKERFIVADINSNKDMAGTNDAFFYAASGIRSVQSTPLVSRRGNVVGMMSTHWKTVHEPSERELRLFDLLARQAADLLERKQTEEILHQAENKYRIELEQRVLHRTEELGRSNQDLLQFAHVTSHDLKEPIRKIKTFLGLLSAQLGNDLPEKARSYLDKTNRSVNRIGYMIEAILKYSKIGMTEETSGSVDLNGIFNDIEVDLEFLIHEKNAAVVRPVFPLLRGNEILLQQLFYNLLINSLKFARENVPVIVHVTYSFITKDGNNYIEICFADNGIGFEPEYNEVIFETFSRLHSKDQYEGTGLGLALCRKIVGRHRGTIRAEGKDGEGALFVIRLPT
ncbi:MAG: GAF domain-containing protein [Ferruginibacter sp.]